MAVERFGLIKVGGKDATVIGEDIKVGQAAPDFSVQALDWSVKRGLADTAGKVRIIAAVPSLDTEVCDRETRRFNQEAASLSQDVVIEVISTDLPLYPKALVRCGRRGSGHGAFRSYDGRVQREVCRPGQGTPHLPEGGLCDREK